MVWAAGILGLMVGFLIGLTGMGGGAMMTPLLVWTGWATPSVAVGTDLVWTALTKIVGATVHYREKNVHLSLVWHLAAGSVPGALLGVYLLGMLKKTEGVEYVDHLILHLLGGTLIVVALTIALREYMHGRYPPRSPRLATDKALRTWQVPVIGFVVGAVVAFTSVGSGSLIITSLLFLFPGERLKNLVGSDVFHGMLLVGVAGLGHWHFGDVDVRLVSGLLLGSIPGVYLGSLLVGRISEHALRPAVAMLLFFTGIKLV